MNLKFVNIFGVTAILILLTAFASAQTFIAGGAEVGGNRVEFRDNAQVFGIPFAKGARIDRYNFFGGWGEAQADFPLGDSFSIAARGLGEISTDPKNLGQDRDGVRYHLRPEVELGVKITHALSAVIHGGGGYTHIRNSQYNKSGLNPHAGIGIDYYKKYRATFARIFPDRTNYNENETEGYRIRGDALYPFAENWGAKVGFEFTRYYANIPGLIDANSVFPCQCVRTQGNAIVFRVGIARLFEE